MAHSQHLIPADSPDVLHDISFNIKSGERVGVVGRTGAGKSTISLALLRGLLTNGKVFYDGLDIHSINLEALRSNITLIPQHPDLLSGSLRQNLDPFGEHDDATLNDALRCAGLFRLQREGDENAITLDS
jgi:ABC-type multidrug transport system fused ATPase/permease subunit